MQLQKHSIHNYIFYWAKLVQNTRYLVACVVRKHFVHVDRRWAFCDRNWHSAIRGGVATQIKLPKTFDLMMSSLVDQSREQSNSELQMMHIHRMLWL